MSVTGIRQGKAAPTRSDPPTHLYAVGQAVRLKGGFGRLALNTDIFHVTGRLPPKGGSPQYRIRSDAERFERVTTQDNLEPVNTPKPDDGANLIERTFGYGQRAETRQSRDQETKTDKRAAQA